MNQNVFIHLFIWSLITRLGGTSALTEFHRKPTDCFMWVLSLWFNKPFDKPFICLTVGCFSLSSGRHQLRLYLHTLLSVLIIQIVLCFVLEFFTVGSIKPIGIWTGPHNLHSMFILCKHQASDQTWKLIMINEKNMHDCLWQGTLQSCAILFLPIL